MHSLNQDYPAVLLREHEPPCLSIYQPTHRQHPDNVQDPVRFRNLVKRLAASLREKYPTRDLPELLKPFEALAEDADFWNHTGDGLAVLGSRDLFRVYRLQRPVEELAVVADSFHTKPLMRIQQSADHYQILGLSRHEYRMFEGNRDAIDELRPIEGAVNSAADLLQNSAEGVAAESGHGSDVRHASDDRDTEQFFRAVDETVLKHWSQPSGRPLILAALPQHHHLFRKVSHNRFLTAEAIDVHPDALSPDALRERAWQVMLPHYLARLAGLVESFGTARASRRGAEDLDDVAKAAVAGRVETLLIEADRLIPGRIDAGSGVITTGNLDNPEVDDVLDDLGEAVLLKGGEVIIVPADRMPTRTGAAAIYRF